MKINWLGHILPGSKIWAHCPLRLQNEYNEPICAEEEHIKYQFRRQHEDRRDEEHQEYVYENSYPKKY